MQDDEPRSGEQDTASPSGRPTPSLTERRGSRTRARTWVIAAQYNNPEEYGIPPLPAWSVSRADSRGIALAANADADPFVRADQPMKVRR